jgi:hypothetical protein
MAGAKSGKAPDPLGKRALYRPPAATTRRQGLSPQRRSAVVLPVGKRALYSGERPRDGGERAVADDPLVERGPFTVRCQRCWQVSRIGALELLIFQFPVGVWLPRGRFDRRMTCPSCRKRSWCSVTLRRD